jgi:hypothetical protein
MVIVGVVRKLNCAAIVGLFAVCALQAANPEAAPPDSAPQPVAEANSSGKEGPSVQWGSLIKETLFLVSVQHSFRVATDPGVRDGLTSGFLSGYAKSVENLHGWGDGDPFFVNYVGHPIEGAIAGDIWIHNDMRYRRAEFGRNRLYWTSRLRATAFAWAYSEQFEIGPISEASIGHDQSRFPQQGFVDHVITPVVGAGWMIAEDAIDRFVIKPIENHTGNPLLKILARGFLNPSRAFANCMELNLPWNRETRPGVFKSYLLAEPPPRDRQVTFVEKSDPGPETASTPPFEFATSFNQMLVGAGGRNVACSGGGGSAVFNLNSVIGVETDVSGCKMLGLGANLSGDALTFAVGPRFSYRNASRWTPWLNVLVGGEKLTQEQLNPTLQAAVKAAMHSGPSSYNLHDQYTRDYSTAGFRLSFGGGVDWELNRVVAFRVGNLQYSHVWMRDLDSEPYPNDIRVTTGFVLRIGG